MSDTPDLARMREEIVRDISGETFCGLRVAAWRETHPEHGDKYGHKYSEHWSTPSENPAVKVERLFTETQVLPLLDRIAELEGERDEMTEILHDLVLLDGEESATGGGPGFRGRSDRAWTRARERFEP